MFIVTFFLKYLKKMNFKDDSKVEIESLKIYT